MAELGVYAGGACDGVGDFLAQERAEAVTQAVERDAKRGLGDPEAAGEFGVRSFGLTAACEGGEERVEMRRAFRGLLRAEPIRHGLQQGKRPRAVEGLVGRRFGSDDERGFVERLFAPAVAACGPGMILEIREMMVEGREQPGPETNRARAKSRERFETKKTGEESLHGVFGVGLGKTAAQRMAEQRWPIRGAKVVQGAGADRVRIGQRVPRGVEDKRPAGRGE